MKAPVIKPQSQEPNPIAQSNRDRLRAAGVLGAAVFGGPGCGKTTLISATIGRLMPGVHVGVIACDIGSHRDADRIARTSEQVVQVNTCDGGDRVEPGLIRDALDWLDLKWLNLLFIEHVGTLALAGLPDLGQDASASVFSVAGGDDKADKHPELVSAADVVILNKTDLLGSVPFDVAAFRADVRRIKPNAELIELSAMKGEGLDGWLSWLKARVVTGTDKASHWFG